MSYKSPLIQALRIDPGKREVRYTFTTKSGPLQRRRALESRLREEAQKTLGPDSDPVYDICRFDDDVYLYIWTDYKNRRQGPGWSSTLFPEQSFYGAGVLQACDLSINTTVQCPLTPQEFAQSISWEDSGRRPASYQLSDVR